LEGINHHYKEYLEKREIEKMKLSILRRKGVFQTREARFREE